MINISILRVSLMFLDTYDTYLTIGKVVQLENENSTRHQNNRDINHYTLQDDLASLTLRLSRDWSEV